MMTIMMEAGEDLTLPQPLLGGLKLLLFGLSVTHISKWLHFIWMNGRFISSPSSPVSLPVHFQWALNQMCTRKK